MPCFVLKYYIHQHFNYLTPLAFRRRFYFTIWWQMTPINKNIELHHPKKCFKVSQAQQNNHFCIHKYTQLLKSTEIDLKFVICCDTVSQQQPHHFLNNQQICFTFKLENLAKSNFTVCFFNPYASQIKFFCGILKV